MEIDVNALNNLLKNTCFPAPDKKAGYDNATYLLPTRSSAAAGPDWPAPWISAERHQRKKLP